MIPCTAMWAAQQRRHGCSLPSQSTICSVCSCMQLQGAKFAAALRRKPSGRPWGRSRRRARDWQGFLQTFRVAAGRAVATAVAQACGRGLQMR